VVVAVGVMGLEWHYFTDTVGGAALGVGTVCGLAFILDLPVVARALAWPGRRRSATQPKASV
jgi:membrane-associated phospholipid phosphatase